MRTRLGAAGLALVVGLWAGYLLGGAQERSEGAREPERAAAASAPALPVLVPTPEPSPSPASAIASSAVPVMIALDGGLWSHADGG